MRDLAALKQEVDDWKAIEIRVVELSEMLDLAIEERDGSLLDSFSEEHAEIEAKLSGLEFKLMLSGEFDDRDSIIALHSGADGVDSHRRIP
ncbi:MAG TPA: PCRF domain-containing protein, partial [Dehalococcoidia bacterium]|nr:PCRF domain-containing protein [Dehalococcoidia bacterium]